MRNVRHLAGVMTWLAVAACLLAPAVGCAARNVTQLSGVVTLDGVPIEKGTIRLQPVDGKAPTAEAIIVDGKYSLTTAPGSKTVEIHGLRKIGTRQYHEGDPTSPMVDVNEETVPGRYNTQTELKADLQAGPQILNFELTGV